MVSPSTSNTNLPAKGGSVPRVSATVHSLPRAFVQVADLAEQPDPVAVLEVQQPVQVPVQVVGEIGHLLPQLVELVVP